MLNTKKIITYLVPVILSCAFSVTAHASTPAQRIWGNNRYETSINTSYAGWTTSKYAILATGESYPDALSAAPLSKKYNAPIILTTKDSVSDSVKNELKRLNVSQVFIAGGTGVVSSDVEQQLNSMGILTTRLAGINRYATSSKIAEKLDNSDKVVITTGDDFTDAISISSIAASKGIPILLVSKDYIDNSTKTYLSSKAISKAYVIGDSSIISDNIVNQIPNAERITGNDKYERNVNIINKFADGIDFSRLYVANGEAFPDALSGSAIAAKTSSAILLTSINPSSSTKNFISNNISKFKEVDILGGSGVVSSSTLSQLGDIQELKYMSDSISPYYTDIHYDYEPVKINQKMTMAGIKYNKGYLLKTHQGEKTSFNLGGNYKTINGLIGIDDNYATHETTLNILGDDKVLATYTLKPGNLPQNLNLNVEGISKLDFQFDSSGYRDEDDVVIINPILDFSGTTLPTVSSYSFISNNETQYMSDIISPYYTDIHYDYEPVKINQKVTMAGINYNKGYLLKTHQGEKTSFNLGGNYKTINGLIGIDDNYATHETTLNILGDNKVLATYTLKVGDLPQKFNLNVEGISKLDFQFDSSGYRDEDDVVIINPIIQ